VNWIELDQEFRKAFAELLRDPASYRESELDHRRLQIWDFGYIGLAQFSSLPMSRRVACTYSDIDSRFPNLFFEDEAIDPLWQVSVSDSLKERLFSGNDAWGLWFLACQPNLTGEDLERLLRECDSLRTRPGTDTERTSFDYREDKTVADVEWQIVGHPNVTADILERLSRADSEVVRRAVAGHKSCDLASLQRLASESSVKIRCSVAGNPNCDEQALRCLSNDEEDAVVASMARNGNAPLSLLEEIIDRGGPYARAAAAKNPNLSLSSMAKLAHGEDEKIKYDLAQNPRCPGEVLRELLTSDDSYVIGAVLENKGCPTDILKRYANSERAYFRKKVVWNQKTPADVVRKIALDLSEKARIEQYVYLGSEENDLIFAIVTSEHCTAEIVRALPVHEMMIQFGWHSDLFVTTGTLHGAHEILRGFAESPYEWVREKAFGHPSCPEDLLVTAAVHSSRKIRHAALMNPSCPSLVIDILTHGDTLEWLATNARAKEILALLGTSYEGK
jgi:hypothetical protein